MSRGGPQKDLSPGVSNCMNLLNLGYSVASWSAEYNFVTNIGLGLELYLLYIFLKAILALITELVVHSTVIHTW